jgi:hypothetical protein
VATKSTGRGEVMGKTTFPDNFRRILGRMPHRSDDTFEGPFAPPMPGRYLAKYHPVGRKRFEA